MITRFCLCLPSKSKSTSEKLRNSNILVLPSNRTLRDYKNAIAPQTGFPKQIIDNLNKLARDCFDIERYVCLLIDKMKVKSNLVFDKHSGERIGLSDLGDPEKKIAIIEEENNTLTTHALVCYLRDGASPNRFFIYNNLQNDNIDIRFKTIKLYARYRNIYFIFYASHLIKTARNCLHNPVGGKHLRHV